jgi:hypothetical protein
LFFFDPNIEETIREGIPECEKGRCLADNCYHVLHANGRASSLEAFGKVLMFTVDESEEE